MSFQPIKDLFHDKRWPSDIRRPAWQDFKEKRIPIPQPLFDDATRCLKENRLAVLQGYANRGKTYVAYAIAFSMTANEDCVAEYASAPDVDYSEEIATVRRRHLYHGQNFLYILDDCNKRFDDALKFIQWISGAGDGACRFLFLTRGVFEDEPIDTTLRELKSRGCIFRVTPTEQQIREIIMKYIECITPLFQNSTHLKPTDFELQTFIKNKVGTDLDRLMRFLKEAWDPNSQSLQDASEARILRSIWSNYSLNNVQRREALAVISALGQFDIEVSAPFLENASFAEPTEALLQAGHLFLRNTGTGRYFRLADSKDSEYVFKAIASDRSPDIEQYRTELMKNYIRSKPPNTINVFHALFENGQKRLLSNLFRAKDTMEALQAALTNKSFTAIDHVVNRLEIAGPELTTKLLTHSELSKQYEKGVRGGPAYRVRHALASLHGTEAKRRFFAQWSEKDYLDTIKSTPRINTLRLLFYDLQQGELPDIAIAFVNQLLNSDLEQLLAPGNQISLKDLNRFIGNLRFIPETLGVFLCRKLVAIDLSTLLSGSVARDVTWLQWQLLCYSRQAASIFGTCQ